MIEGLSASFLAAATLAVVAITFGVLAYRAVTGRYVPR